MGDKSTDVLLRRLRAAGLDIPPGSTVRRTRAGHVQRSAGAWSWFIEGPDGRELGIGSQYAVATLLKSKLVATRDFGSPDTHIDTIRADEYLDRNRWRTYVVEA